MSSNGHIYMKEVLLDLICTVDPSVEELKRRLESPELSWPSVLTAEKNELLTHIAKSIVAENEKHWEVASQELQSCLGILITHKSSIPQKLKLWLARRICVPLAFISQFRLNFQSTGFHVRERDLKTASKAMRFMYQIVRHYDYGEKGPTGKQARRQNVVAIMALSVSYEYAKLRAQADGSGLPDELDTNSELYINSEIMSSELCAQHDLKARCCEYLCIQYYKVGELGIVNNWLEEWKTCIEDIADETERLLQERDREVFEAMLFAEHGADKERAREWIRDLEKLYHKLFIEGNNEERLKYIGHVIVDIRFKLLRDENQALHSTWERLGLLFDSETPDLDMKRIRRALDSARDEAAIKYYERYIERVQSEYDNYPSGLARALSEFRFQQAQCHKRLFLQKELKFFIDTMENKCSSSDEISTSFSGASLKLCAHHCWSPHCQHDNHKCPETEDEDEDEDEDDEELAALGHHELESPTEFYRSRNIESDGNNLIHLEKAIELLDKALEYAKKAGSDVYYVVSVQSSLAHTHLRKAWVQTEQLVLGSNSSEQITLEFLDSNRYHTIGQVHDYLDRNGTSPTKAFRLSHFHYQQCSQMFTEHLDTLQYYSATWVDAIEKQRELYDTLQYLIFVTVDFDTIVYRMLCGLKNRSTDEVRLCEDEYWEILKNGSTEALLWSERGRARFLERQLYQREQLRAEDFPESRNKDLSVFYSDDQVAWEVIRSSLDTCGEGTVFLEYAFEGESDFGTSANRCGRVYGVHMESNKIMEPRLMEEINGDPKELQSLIEHLNKAMNQPGSQSEYDEEEVRRDLEKLYTLLIPPPVAHFLGRMHIDHKLVICPSQVFTKVPFAALRNPAEPCVTKGYMFQSHTISITPSIRVLKHNMERYTALQEMRLIDGEGASVAMGDPCYTNEDRRLENSGAEVEAIASLFPNRCKLLKYRDATVGNLLKSAELPSKRSQAFVHIAAHCETDGANKKQGILRLAKQDCSDMASSSSTPPVNSDGILSAENVLKSIIEWCAHMIFLSACGSGKGEIKADGVLNLARAFMVAGIPCSVVSQWKVEDDSTAQLMTLFYQRMLQGLDVATALRSTMQEMLDKGFNIKQWAPFMVWGLPTVCLPDELLSEGAEIKLLERGDEMIRSDRHSNAILPLKKSLKLLKAIKNPPTDDLVRCLSLLTDCEENNYRSAQSKELDCLMYAVLHDNFKWVTMRHRDKYKADECRHLTSAVGYLDEALKYERNGDLGKRFEDLNFQLASWKIHWTLPRGRGIDIVVEYSLILPDPTPHQTLFFCVRSQGQMPRHLARKVGGLNRLKTASQTASMISADSSPESGSFLTALEYLHEILIKPLLEDSLISATQHQTLVFIPCEFLVGVPFALLRDGAQPDGAGYLMQTHTVSIVPSVRKLNLCYIRVLHHQTLLLMPDASVASLVLSNPAISHEEMETGDSGPAFAVASLFPNHFEAKHGADSTVDSLSIWASLPSSCTEEYCQAFFHMEAEIGEGFAEEIEKCGPSQWSARFAVVRACPSTNGQIQKEAMIRGVEQILRHRIPCVIMSNYPVFDVSSDVFFTHLYTKLKSGESVGAAVRHSMLEMKNVEGFDLDQWASFSVFGDPTVRLPEEMLRSPENPRDDSDLLLERSAILFQMMNFSMR